MTRALATIETITSIEPIDGADNIVRARIRNWDVIVKRDEFTPGDMCIYLEVDTAVDISDPRYAFLAARGTRTDPAGRIVHVLKTAKLRGHYSQGLALPASAFPELGPISAERAGEDVTAHLDIQRWEPPLPANLNSSAYGPRPTWIPKTDEERIQNVAHLLTSRAHHWIATEKIDGTSTSYYTVRNPHPGQRAAGVCSRNLELRPDDTNTLWTLARHHELFCHMNTVDGDRIVVQGETYGESIQGNPLGIRGQRFAAFALHVDGAEIPRNSWPGWLTALAAPTHDLPFPETVDEALAQVENLRSKIAPERAAEGIVWRTADTITIKTSGDSTDEQRPARGSFKAISNRYLLKHDR